MPISMRRPRSLLAALLLLLATACQDSGTPATPVPGPGDHGTPLREGESGTTARGDKPAKCEETIQDRLKKNLKLVEGAKVQIAPVAEKGTSKPGTWTDVDGDIFKAIFKRIGIDPCASDAKDLKGKPGFISYIPKSEVLNKGGERATFGYFIKVKQGDSEVEYFALFSYDKITAQGKVICATEFFLFGPFKRKGGKIDPNPPELDKGLAIDKDGCLLPEVPLDLAKVKNFLKEGHEGTEPVKPIIDKKKKDEGCLLCHSGGGGFPNETIPFPWDKEE
jgi:hypothetical protein